MRVNEPITSHEIEVPDGEPLVSRTDPAGRIVFVNRIFVSVSGFQEHELVGAPHNLVRHPHMPPAAFANLWATIKAGRPWDGLVKNRPKSGDFYWVRANVTPVVEAGADHRFHLHPQQSDARRGCRGRGQPMPRSAAAGKERRTAGRRGGAQRLARATVGDAAGSVLGRLVLAMMAAALVVAAVGWLGFSGMAASNAVLRHVYEHDLVAVDQLRGVVERVRDTATTSRNSRWRWRTAKSRMRCSTRARV